MNVSKIKVENNIKESISSFSRGDLFDNSITLFNTLGYNTSRQNRLNGNSFSFFNNNLIDADDNFNEEKALTNEWNKVELLFQLTNEEVTGLTDMFSSGKFDNTVIESYLFFAVELNGQNYSRTKLSSVTREINKLFSMPVMVLFFYDNKITLAVINRRLHKRDSSKDVLEKVTLIKDIRIENPHRAHIEILYDLSFPVLVKTHKVTNFVELHRAWEKVLDTKELNKKFFKELSNWYFWAVNEVEFPDDAEIDRDKRNPISVIRLITRLMFVWFIKEKGLINQQLFDKNFLDTILNYNDVTGSTYYKAILQNLFFATLNTEMNKDESGNRKFVKDQYLVHTLYRYGNLFKDKNEALKLFENIPFLNGGLFECLDRKDKNDNVVRIDCFSENLKNQKRLTVPDFLFFGDEQIVDLSEVYGNKKKNKEKVRPLIDILNSYKFTIDENTPIEEEVALDPELLGKVFENLLANYNPETKTTARKQTGSFYTPREIVNYMVDESLIAYFLNILTKDETPEKEKKETENKLRNLFEYNEQPNQFDDATVNILISAIDKIKILDPAAGSGAFPMGILHRLVFLLHKLDPHNEKWKQKQIDKISEIEDPTVREQLLTDVEESFTNNELDYGRKLYLIENCIYGVDIQPVAVQIAKLRFFISLVVDQKVNTEKKNFGIRPLPNLETKFVAANTLIGLGKEDNNLFTNPNIDEIKNQLKDVRHRYFTARTHKTKEKYRKKDKELREKLSALLTKEHYLQPKDAKMIANWDPYDQNASSPFFDPEWMFGITKGFDVVIGNPPYITPALGKKQNIFTDDYINQLKNTFNDVFEYKGNTYSFFIKISLKLLKENGCLNYIIPNTLLLTSTFSKTRQLLIENTCLSIILNFQQSVFNEAETGGNLIIVAIKEQRNNKCNKIKVKEFESYPSYFENWKYILLDQDTFYKSDLNKFHLNPTTSKLLGLIKGSNIPLGNIVKFYQGIITGDNNRFISNEKKNSKYKKILRGKDIKSFYYVFSENYVLFDKDLLWSNTNEAFFLVEEKLINRQTGDKLIAAYDNKQFFSLDSTHVQILIDDKFILKYILAIFNSKVLNYYYSLLVNEGGRTFAQVKTVILKQLPIPCSNKQKLITSIVDFILYEIIKFNNKEILFYQHFVDFLVFELYFPDHMKEREIDILKYVEEDINQVMQGREFEKLTDTEKEKVIETLHKKWTAPNSIVRKRIELMPIKSLDIIKPILES